MKQILDDILAQHKKGLVLLDMPTGTGKTYQVTDYITEHIDQLKSQNRKIIFITHLKKNLPLNELEERLIEKGKFDAYHQEVWFVQGKLDAFKINFSSCMDDLLGIFNNFKAHELDTLLTEYKQVEKTGVATVKQVFEDSIQKHIQILRDQIKQKLFEDFDTPEKRIHVLKHDSDWQWVTKLFPATLTLDKDILFMSVSKFIYPYDTLVQSPMTLMDLLADFEVTLFIDEIDASKLKLQDYIIEQGLKKPIDLVYTLSQISMVLSNSRFPDTLLPEHKLDKQPDDPATIEQNLKEKCLKVTDDFQLSLSLKNRQSPAQSAFIFYDNKPLYLANAQHQVLTLTAEAPKGTLWIDTVKKTVDHDKESLTLGNLLGDASQAIGYFKGGMYMLANNYHANYRIDGITFDNAVKSYLNHFEFKESSFKNLVYEIQYARLTNKWKLKPSGLERDKDDPLRFHEQGFSYHTIIDSADHVGHSIVDTYSFPYSPEALMLGWCSNFMVVGVSATANIPSRLGNYDLHYLEQRLKKDPEAQFIRTDNGQQQRISDQVKVSTCHYYRANIQVEAHGLAESEDEIAVKDAYIKLFGGEASEDVVQDLFNTAPIKSEDTRLHQLKQFYKIFELWTCYHQQQINAFLVLFSKGYAKELAFIKKYCSLLSQNLALPNTAEEEIVCIVGLNSEDRIEAVKADLSKGQRRFVISTYATLGAGVNIQYDIPAHLAEQIVTINEREPNDKMDFDGLYLDKPTRLITHLNWGSDISQKDLVNLIFQLEYLKLSDLSVESFDKHLQNAFNAYAKTGFPQSVERLTNFKDYKAYMMQVLIQAIGRICRTNRKCPTIRLHIDQALTQHWFDEFNEDHMLPEFKKISEFIKKQNKQPNTLELAMQQQDFQKIRAFIDQMKAKISACTLTPEFIGQWQNLREIVLQHPQRIANISSAYDFLYTKFDQPKRSYYYLAEDDYDECKLIPYATANSYEASNASARLDRLMKHPGIYQHFVEKGYVTELVESRYWIQPILFNNIYKGALGEVGGRYLWESYNLPQLQELPTKHFELFDYQVAEGIYVDFKNWKPSTQDGQSEREKIYQKMHKTGAKLVFLINIVADTEQFTTPFRTYPHPDKGREQLIVEMPYFTRNENVADIEQLKLIRELIKGYQTL